MNSSLRLVISLVLLGTGLGAGACSRSPEPSSQPSSQPTGKVAIGGNFELDCSSSDTATAAQLYCVRTDTRTGDVLRVNYMNLPTSNGPTGETAGVPGRFTTQCAATSTDARSDFYCIRLNTDTGEMLLLNLQKVGSLPPTSH
jgi:hypothetical protein